MLFVNCLADERHVHVCLKPFRKKKKKTITLRRESTAVEVFEEREEAQYIVSYIRIQLDVFMSTIFQIPILTLVLEVTRYRLV